MKFNKLKNFVILILVTAAVFQTGTLWLGGNPSHNFFYSFNSLALNNNEQKNLPKATVDPERVVVGYGNKSFNVTYPGLQEKPITQQTNEYVKNVIENHTSYYIEDLEYEKYIGSKTVIYEFSFDVLAREYFYDSKAEFLTDELTFNRLIAVPASSSSKINLVYLVDDKALKTLVIENSKEIKNTDLATEIDIFGEESQDQLRYSSMVQSGLSIFGGNVFVPQWSQKELSYKGIAKIGVLNDEESAHEDIENATIGFFGGYSHVDSPQDETGVYILSDEVNIVKYYPTDVLEYYSYNQDNEKQQQSLSTAYYACKEFLKKDKMLQTNLSLCKVQLQTDGGLLFCFNYNVNDLPIILDDDIQEALNSKYAVEVVVENNKVKKYKRYFFEYELDLGSEIYAENDFVYAMNEVIRLSENEINQIDSIYLGYYDSFEGSNDITLGWSLGFEEDNTIVNANKVE